MPVDRLGRQNQWGTEESKPFVRKLLARSWYVFIPLIGVWWGHMRDLTPQVHAIEAQMEQDRQTVEQTRTASLKEARTLGIQISRLRAFQDTVAVRREQITSFLDSVRVMQEANLEETHLLEAQVDSLRKVLSAAEGQSLDYSAQLQEFQAKVDSLRVLISDHRGETVRLGEEIAQAEDLTDRVLFPEKYRRNDALVAGEGEFPDRDALPER